MELSAYITSAAPSGLEGRVGGREEGGGGREEGGRGEREEGEGREEGGRIVRKYHSVTDFTMISGAYEPSLSLYVHTCFVTQQKR